MVVPLTANLHASGITSVLEATLLGKPVVVSDAGGIDWYFGRDELAFCPVGDAAALRSAVEAIAARPEDTKKRIRAAQATMTRKDLTSRGYRAAPRRVDRRTARGAETPRNSRRIGRAATLVRRRRAGHVRALTKDTAQGHRL